MPEIVLSGVSKKYGAVLALDNVDLRVQDGDFCIIVGPSGSGKTTLLHTIAGFVKPDQGQVYVDSLRFNDLLPRERDIGMVFQDIALFSHLSVRRNLSFGLDIRKGTKSEIQRKVAQIAATLKIERLMDKKPKLLSGGEAQRVAIGRALITEPSFFLFDEPMGNLDANLRMEMLAELKALHLRLHKTFLYVTHDQEQTLAAATKVVIMKDGKIMQAGHPTEIYFDPKCRFVAEFFGVAAMNLIEGRLSEGPQGTFFQGGGLTISLPTFARHTGATVALGVRPESVSVGKDANPISGFGTVNGVEFLGDRNNISITIDQDKPIAAVTAPELRPEVKDRLQIGMNEERILLFDIANGERLRP